MSKDKKLGFVFYKEFPEKMFTEEEKSALQYSFIINSLLFRWIITYLIIISILTYEKAAFFLR